MKRVPNRCSARLAGRNREMFLSRFAYKTRPPLLAQEGDLVTHASQRTHVKGYLLDIGRLRLIQRAAIFDTLTGEIYIRVSLTKQVTDIVESPAAISLR